MTPRHPAQFDPELATLARAGDKRLLLSSDSSLIRGFAQCWIVVAGIVYFADLIRQTTHGLTDGSGRPLGDDFVNYWSGAFLAWHGRTAEIYNWQAFHAFQESVVGPTLGFFHYSYPPALLVLTAPLAILPYVPGLAVWLVASWFAFYRALRLAVPDRSVLLLALATPAVFVNALGGQNGAWTAALLGGGLCLLDRRPMVAGILLGLLIYKPQLGILIPIALLAGQRWRALAAAAASAGTLLALSVILFGVEIWGDYFRNVALLRQSILEDGTGVWHRMVSVFVSMRRLGADVPLAYLIQAAVGVAAAAVVALAWFRDAPAPIRNSLLVLGGLLATPYLQDYDLVVGAFVAVWLTGYREPSKPLEWPVAIAAFLVLALPVLAAPFGQLTGLALGPLCLIPAFVIAARMAPAVFVLPGRR